MSAPSTNVEKQKSRHAGVLRWMAIAVGAVIAMFVVFYTMVTNENSSDVPAMAPAAEEQSS